MEVIGVVNGKSAIKARPGPDQATPRQAAGQQQSKPAKPAQIDGTVLRLSTDELVQLAPWLRGYLATPAPTWPDVVEAADWLRGELGGQSRYGARPASPWAGRRQRSRWRSRPNFNPRNELH